MLLDPPLPDLTGRTAVVTGANAGLGWHCARQFAGAGARVLLACRDEGRAAAAAAAIRREHPAARLDVVRLDLADQASVADAAARLTGERIDLVLCNAGLTETRGRQVSADGHELMLAANHLGHVGLLARLLPGLPPGARVVTVGSVAHRWSPVRPDDLEARRGFLSARQYGRTKTAVMSFAFELDRRARAAGRDLTALSAHPGFALDGLAGRPGWLGGPVVQGKRAGSWPLVHACVAPGVGGGEFWGPGGWQELTGPPALARARNHARDPAVAAALWSASEQLAGVRVRVC